MSRLLAIFFILIGSNGATLANPIIPLDSLFRSASTSQVSFSPNGHYLSSITNESNGPSFSLIDLRTGLQQTLPNFRQQGLLQGYEWIDNNTLYSYTKRGHFFTTLTFLEDRITASHRKVPYDGYVVKVFPTTGKLLFAKQRPWESGGYELHMLTIEQLLENNLKEGVQLGTPRRKTARLLFDEQTKWILATTYDDEDKVLAIYHRTLDNARWRLLTELEQADYRFNPVGFLSETTLAVLTNKVSDTVGLYEYDVVQKTLTRRIFGHPEFDLISAQLSKNGSAMGVRSVRLIEHGELKTVYFDAVEERISSRINSTFADKQWYSMALHVETGKRVVNVFASDDPGSLYMFDPQNDRLELLFAMYPDSDSYHYAKTQVGTVRSEDGVDIEYYYTPATNKDYNTLLVMPHGGPIGVRDYAVFSQEVQYFANRGFNVLQVNFRGSEGFGKAFLASGQGQFGKLIEQDITTVLAHIKSQHSFKHVCSVGASYGAYSSMMLAIKHPQTYDCVIASFGIYDLPLMFNESNLRISEEHRQRVENVVGPFSNDLQDTSPVYLAKDIQAPVFLIAGETDRVAVLEHTKRMEYVLKRANKPVKTLYYKDTGHGHSNWKWDRHQHAAMHEFLINTLGLPHPLDTTDKLSADHDTLAQESILMSDALLYKSNVAKDVEKGVALLQQAADKGAYNALYNLGWINFNGYPVDKNTQKAVEFYQQAADAGSPGALFQLGKLYAEGEHIALSKSKAFQSMMASHEQGVGPFSDLHLAKYYCLGIGIPKHIELCSEHLRAATTQIGPTSTSYRNVVMDVLSHESITSSDREQLSKVTFVHDRGLYEEVSFNLKEVGTFRNNFAKTLKQPTSIISSKEKEYFGIKFDFSYQDPENAEQQLGLYFRWRRKDADGTVTTTTNQLKKQIGTNWRLLYTISDEKIAVGEWLLDVYDLNLNLLFEHTFTVTDEA